MGYTPEKLTWNLKIIHLPKEKHLPDLHFVKFHPRSRGCMYFFSSKPLSASTSLPPPIPLPLLCLQGGVLGGEIGGEAAGPPRGQAGVFPRRPEGISTLTRGARTQKGKLSKEVLVANFRYTNFGVA